MGKPNKKMFPGTPTKRKQRNKCFKVYSSVTHFRHIANGFSRRIYFFNSHPEAMVVNALSSSRFWLRFRNEKRYYSRSRFPIISELQMIIMAAS